MTERDAMSEHFATVAVIGAGTMGAGIAQICAGPAASRVRLVDSARELLERGMAGITAFLEKGVQKGKTSKDERDATLARLEPTLDVTAAVRDADLVIEAVPEDLALKQRLFAAIAAVCSPRAVLATNTSSLSLAGIFAGVKEPARCIGMHFFNPPPLMPLLEVVRTEHTSQAVIDSVLGYARRLGKEPIVVKDSPGFASSRLGVALGLEAIRMVEEGVASPADIDKAMELGYRHPMGPLRLSDLVGLDVRMAIAAYLHQELHSEVFEVPQLMRDMVAQGKLGKKTGRGFYEWKE
jgi:3-hydroxybutyryl-CoA dehydrogenase